MALHVDRVESKNDFTEFIQFPNKLLRKDPNYVAPLISDVKKLLNEDKNPFFLHAKVQLFIAKYKGKTLGRIASIIDDNYIEKQGLAIGNFGFFDAINDVKVAKALFNTVSMNLREEGMLKMLGPCNPSMNDEIGVLINKFDEPPAIKMVWNPPYYKELYEVAGFKKAMDVFAYNIITDEISEKLISVGEKLIERNKIQFRTPNLKKFDQELELFRNIYNNAWSDNWGFVPWTEEEFNFTAKDIKQIMDKEIVLIAEIDGKPAGFLLALPDLNFALKHINGRLFPFGLPVVMWHARKIKHIRVAILGVMKEFRRRGIDAVLIYELYRKCKSKGYVSGELSWVLENNVPMTRLAESIGAKVNKTYRIYERAL